MRKRLPILVFIGALTIIVVYLTKNLSSYRELIQLSPRVLLIMAGLAVVEVALLGLTNTIFYRSLDVPLAYKEGIGLAAVNSLGNLLPFAGGMASKGVYLKRRHGLPYGRFVGATLSLYVCFVSASGVLGLVVMGLSALTSAVKFVPLIAAMFALMTFSLLLILAPELSSALSRIEMLPTFVSSSISRMSEGWIILQRNPQAIAQLMLLQIVMTILIGVRFWLAFDLVSQNISLLQGILLASSTVLSLIIAVAPGGFGVREGLVTGLSGVLGFQPAASLLAVGIDRLTSTSVVIIAGVFFSYILAKWASLSDNTMITVLTAREKK